MSVPDFLAAVEPLIAPLDSFFDAVFVMCEEQVGWISVQCLHHVLACLPNAVVCA